MKTNLTFTCVENQSVRSLMNASAILIILTSSGIVASIGLSASAADSIPDGVVNGAATSSFFGSGAYVSPEAMEKASIPADRAIELPPSHNVAPPKPGQTEKPHKFFRGIGRAFAHTSNFIGFPVGADKDVDASLSSDLKNEKNQAEWDRLAKQKESATNSSSTTLETTKTAATKSGAPAVQAIQVVPASHQTVSESASRSSSQ